MEDESGWTLVGRKFKYLFSTSSLSSIIPPPISRSSKIVIAIDSAASNHYSPLRDAFVLNDLHGPTVILPDSSNLTATMKGHLPIKGLSSTATEIAVFKNHSSLQ